MNHCRRHAREHKSITFIFCVSSPLYSCSLRVQSDEENAKINLNSGWLVNTGYPVNINVATD